MRERPILFSAPMVRAILEGRKTQTRRLVKPQPSEDWHPEPIGMYAPIRIDRHGDEYPGSEVYGASDESEGRVCPYGQLGDRLWVKETWQSRCWAQTTGTHVERVLYAADHSMLDKYVTGIWSRPKAGLGDKFVTPLFMPRWASRILVENTQIRVERLQDITESDAIAEGATPWEFGPEQCLTTGERGAASPYRSGFACLWDEINAHRATWKSNPWVWAVTFREVNHG